MMKIIINESQICVFRNLFINNVVINDGRVQNDAHFINVSA